MAERDRIESIVERVVAEVLESHTVQLREEIVRRVTEEAASLAEPEAPPASNGVSSADLVRSLSEIHAGTTQREILKALLDSCARYAARAALFVVKAGSATGWQGRGFSDNDTIKDFALEVTAPAIHRAIEEHVAVNANFEELDGHFLERFGKPAHPEVRLLPLMLKDKVAALVYADGGSEGGHPDSGCLELLVLSTSAWLEVNSLRKQALKAPAGSGDSDTPATSAPVAAATSFSDPFAAHTPSHAMAAAAGAEMSAAATATAVQPAPEIVEPAVVEAEPALEAEPAPPPEAEPAAAPSMSPEQQETLRKAQRFARLLIDEIKLYNQAKVTEGRKNKDVYDRLKDAIEKSRATYQKRYGNTVATASDYFQHELVRSLAEDDISIMGANFPK